MSLENSKNTEALVRTSVDMFKRRGYLKVSVNEICKESGISRSSFYSVFSGKKEIITHILSTVKTDQSTTLQSFVTAENDFERMWSLCDRYLKIALDFGPELTGSLFALELEEPIGLYENVHSTNDWLTILTKKCQEQGIIRIHAAPEAIVPIATNAAYQTTYDWCRLKGGFPLEARTRRCVEIVYDVTEEYRAKWAIE